MDSVEIKGRKFTFKAPTAWDGCAIFYMLTAYDIPFGASWLVGMESVKRPMPPKELETFLRLCLKNCYEELPDEPAPVVDEDGGIGIIGGSSPLLTQIASQYISFFLDWWRAENS